MSNDIKIFLEQYIDNEWVLINVDPVYSSYRNPERIAVLYKLDDNKLIPGDISKGTDYWFGASDKPNFIASFPILEAAKIWHETELNSNWKNMDLQSQLLTYFGLWEAEVNEWRIIVGI